MDKPIAFNYEDFLRLQRENAELQQTVDLLTEETIRLRADRDAAVADLHSLAHKYSFSMCNCCKNKGSNKCRPCYDDLLTLPEYEWRGVQSGETCTSCSLDELWEQINGKGDGG